MRSAGERSEIARRVRLWSMACTHPMCVVLKLKERCLFAELPFAGSVPGGETAQPPQERLQKVTSLLERLDSAELRAACASELKRREMTEVLEQLAPLVREEVVSLSGMHDASAREKRAALLLDLVKNFASSDLTRDGG